MRRYLEKRVKKDLPHKIVLVTGPRQCGKTTFSKQLVADYDYLNFDSAEDRQILQEKSWDRQKPLLIFDELHKMKNWKRWLKGVYDTEGIPPQMLVTGSAKLDTYRKVGDSLAGRFFQFRLHTIDLKEALEYWKKTPEEIFDRLMKCSGFPEPFFKGSETYYRRWQRSHLDIILRQDLLDLYAVHDIKSIETLVHLLKKRVGSTVSYANLANDLQKDQTTIKRWLQLLENLYVIYRVTPYHKNIARSLLKEPKYYFYDHMQADDIAGARLENIVANAILKKLHFIEDTEGKQTHLHYVRTKEGKEVDFLIVIDDKPTQLIEVKKSDGDPSPHFAFFSKYLPDTQLIQLVLSLKREKTYPSGLQVRSLLTWLAKMPIF